MVTGDGAGRPTSRPPARPPGPTLVPGSDPDLIHQVPAVLYSCLADELWTGVEITPSIAELAQLSAARWAADPDAWLRLVHPDDRSRLLRARIDAMASGELDCIYRIQRPDGETVWVQDEARCRTEGVFGLLRDVSKENRANDAMSRLHGAMAHELARLRASEAARDAFVRTFVHDVRSSLRQAKAIAGAQELHTPSGLDPVQAILGDLHALVDDILWIGEVGPEDEVVRPQPVQLPAITEAAIHEAGATEQTTVEASVGEVVLDPIIMRRVLVNLIGNAVRHNPPGTRVRVHLFRTEENVVITVEDDGRGVSDEERERIFEPFVRLAEDRWGWGIGLSLVQQLVRMHGGRIWVDDPPGGGSSFNVVLPQPAAAGDDVPDVEATGRLGTAVPMPGHRVVGRSATWQKR